MTKKKRRRPGFTLIESLLVVSIMGSLAAIIFFTVNPARQFADVRNGQRKSNTKTILDAIHQHAIDHNGVILTTLDSSLRMLGTAGSGCEDFCAHSDFTSPQCLDLSAVLVNDYLASMPYDPRFGSPERTFYAVKEREDGRLVVLACEAELGMEIGYIR